MDQMTEIHTETLQEAPTQASQPPAMEPPIAEVNPLKDLSPELSEAQVRAAIANAEASGIDPLSLKMSDLDIKQETAKTEAPPQETKPYVEIPEKFKKPNGEVDVEKLKISTERLNEAVQQKEQKVQEVQKTIEEMFEEYKALEKKNSQLPNPDKLAASIPPAPVPQATNHPSQLTDDQLEQLVNADISKNPAKVIAEFTKIQLEKMLGPIQQERHDNAIKDNLKALVQRDSRVTHPQVWSAIQAELATDPDYWKLKNPHKAAWLEVKERLHLGEPSPAQAQPSRPVSPILGGGTPPSSPSSQGTQRPVLASLQNLDPRDKKQEAAGDELIRQMLWRNR